MKVIFVTHMDGFDRYDADKHGMQITQGALGVTTHGSLNTRWYSPMYWKTVHKGDIPEEGIYEVEGMNP